jgi:hypothetical protein
MSKITYSRLLHVVSYVLNSNSSLPMISKIQISNAIQDYVLELETRIRKLEQLRQNQIETNIEKNKPSFSLIKYEEKQKNIMKVF